MWRWLAGQYARRVVNINVNITVASVMAMTLTAAVVHLSRYVGVDNNDRTLIMGITLVSDWGIDLFVAVGLHWLASHWPRKWKFAHLIDSAEAVMEAAPPPALSVVKDATHGTHLPPMPHLPMPGRKHEHPKARKPKSFARDATAIQLQRLCLSPVFYAVAIYGQWLMLQAHVAREVSVLLAFGAAIVVTRLLHTVWLLKADKEVLEEYEAAKRYRQKEHEDAAAAKVEAKADARHAKEEAKAEAQRDGGGS